MVLLETIAIAFSMFSSLPVPQVAGNEKNMRYMLCAFPLVGVLCGVVFAGWCALCVRFDIPQLLRAAGMCVLPVMVNGGIHLDGYMDATDALASNAAPARKQEILRDPHNGAFAVIRVCCYFICSYALCAVLFPSLETIACVALSFVLSRVLSGFALTVLPLADETAFTHYFMDHADLKRVRTVLVLEAVLVSAGLLYFGGLTGVAVMTAALLVFAHYAHVAAHAFPGTNGDLAGWFLVRAEVYMLAASVLVQLAKEWL